MEGSVDSEGAPCCYVNFYCCERCQHKWQDQWSGTCDSNCPACGDGGYTPVKSAELDLAGAYTRMISQVGVNRPIKITEDQWDEWFGPGDLLDLDDAEDAAADERQIWTEVDDPETGGYLIYPGRHLVNRIGYFVANQPWDDRQMFVQIPRVNEI